MDPNNSYTPKTSKDARINPEIMEKQPMIAKSKHAASFIMGKELNVTGFEKGVEEVCNQKVKGNWKEEKKKKKRGKIGSGERWGRKNNIEGGHRKHASQTEGKLGKG